MSLNMRYTIRRSATAFARVFQWRGAAGGTATAGGTTTAGGTATIGETVFHMLRRGTYGYKGLLFLVWVDAYIRVPFRMSRLCSHG